MLIAAVLKEKEFSLAKTMKIVEYHIVRNEKAYRSHRKSTIQKYYTEICNDKNNPI